MTMNTRRHRWGLGLALALAALGGCDDGSAADEASVEFRSEPAPEPDPLPGAACFSSKDCVVEEYCMTPEGECGRVGVCVPAPLYCTVPGEVVCTCDGGTYRNECEAAIDKQAVDFFGECPPPTCADNSECNELSYCAKAANDCGGTGTCEPRPLACSGAWNPVCGCDGSTYANGCKASQAGVVVASLGVC